MKNEINNMASNVCQKHYSFVPSVINKNIFPDKTSHEIQNFINSWNNLSVDNYMGDGGCYRYRRYSVFSYNHAEEKIKLEAHQPHYQEVDYNFLNGGVQRNFEPFEVSFIDNSVFKEILAFSTSICNKLEANSNWHIEAHQFRIIASNDNMGKPTPEGIHCDGRNYVFIMMVGRDNVSGGLTTLYNKDKEPIHTLELQDFSDSIFLDDTKLMHDVSPIQKIDYENPSYRDILVITFYKKPTR